MIVARSSEREVHGWVPAVLPKLRSLTRRGCGARLNKAHLLWLVTFLPIALPALADDVDDAIAFLEVRGANVTLMNDRSNALVTFSPLRLSTGANLALPLSEEDIRNLALLKPKHVTLEGNHFGDNDVEMLSRLEVLSSISLLRTRTTEEAIDRLHDSHPELRIVRSNGPYLGFALNEDATVRHFVKDDSAAERAGLSTGDRITKFAGREITNVHDLLRMVARSKPGDEFDIEVSRGGQSRSLKLQMGRLVVD